MVRREAATAGAGVGVGVGVEWYLAVAAWTQPAVRDALLRSCARSCGSSRSQPAARASAWRTRYPWLFECYYAAGGGRQRVVGAMVVAVADLVAVVARLARSCAGTVARRFNSKEHARKRVAEGQQRRRRRTNELPSRPISRNRARARERVEREWSEEGGGGERRRREIAEEASSSSRRRTKRQGQRKATATLKVPLALASAIPFAPFPNARRDRRSAAQDTNQPTIHPAAIRAARYRSIDTLPACG